MLAMAHLSMVLESVILLSIAGIVCNDDQPPSLAYAVVKK